MRSRLSCLFAIVLAVGGGSAVMGAGPATDTGASGPPVSSRAIDAVWFAGTGLGQISENGDGTAATAVFTSFGTVFIGVLNFANPDYTISTELQPGQRGQPGGSGTAHFELSGVFGFDVLTMMMVGPFDVSVDVGVAGTTNATGYNNNGVTTQADPMTGAVSIVRQTVVGNQAWGDTAGSLSIFVDDGSGAPGLTTDLTGIYGLVQENNVHIVEQLH